MNIYIYDNNYQNRLYYVENVTSVENVQLKTYQNYKDGAIVPNGDWYEYNLQDIHKRDLGIAETIYLIKPKIIELDYLVAIGQEIINSKDDLIRFYNTGDCKFIFDGIEKHLKELISKNFSFERLGIAVRQQNLFTSTIDVGLDKYVGLHVDSWDRKGVNETKTTRNRICFNISSEPRFLIFNFNSVAEIYNTGNYSMSSDVNDLAHNYLLKDPNKLILKLKINPGEAYIAPTENMIHDSSTLNRENLDLSLTYLGYFHPYFLNI